MHQFQRLFAVFIGTLLAAAFYIKIAMGNAMAISHHGFDFVAATGLAGIVCCAIAPNISRPNLWTIIGGLILAALMFCWLFLIAFFVSLPGNEWVDPGMVNYALLFPVTAAAILVLRLWKVVSTLIVSLVCSLAVLAIGIQLSTRWVVSNQISATLARGGCVLAGRETSKPVMSTSDVGFGFFIGSKSDKINFVEGNVFFKWSYSQFGLASRRGQPVSFPVTEEISCK